MALNWSEITKKLIISHLKSHLQEHLDDIRLQRDDAKISLTPVKDYFTYEPSHAFQKPAIYAVVEEIDTRKRQKNANFLSAIVFMNLSVVVEERTIELLTVKVERYQAAIHNALDSQPLVDLEKKVKCVPLVTGASFSPTYTPTPDTPNGTFLKEAVLTLEVEHYENLRT